MRKLLPAALLLGSMPVLAASPLPMVFPLLTAVKTSDHATIRSLIARHADVNAALPDKSTVLAWAVDRQDVESVRLLLAADARPNIVDVSGATPLSLACETGDPDIVTALLRAGANARAARPDGVSALALCAGTSTPEILTVLIAKGADVNAADADGQTALMRAAAMGQAGNIDVLVTHGAHVNAVAGGGFTALFFALRSKTPAAAEALLAAGADTHARLADGTGVIEAALTEGNAPFAVTVFKKQTADGSVNVNARDARGHQLIHIAAAGGSAELVRLVLARGGDANAMTTPPPPGPRIHESGSEDLLVPPPPMPTPPLLLAAHAGSVEAMKALLEAGARPDAKAADGLTLTLAAAGSGKLDAVKYALTLDPDLNARAQHGKSIMQIVVSSRFVPIPDREAIITYLADHGAALDVADEDGQSAVRFVNRVGPEALKDFYMKLLLDRKPVISAAQ
jgi:ankyrin repeat protein